MQHCFDFCVGEAVARAGTRVDLRVLGLGGVGLGWAEEGLDGRELRRHRAIATTMVFVNNEIEAETYREIEKPLKTRCRLQRIVEGALGHVPVVLAMNEDT